MSPKNKGKFGKGKDAEIPETDEFISGVDILARRDLSWGPWLRLASFLDDSQFISGGFRMSWRWGFF